jgi:glutamine synthetase
MRDPRLVQAEDLVRRRRIEFLDLKAVDLTGALHHITLPARPGTLERILRDGVGFDGSSYGFRKVEQSDMVLVPDLASAMVDPFREAPTLSFFANVLLTDTARTPFPQDGRALAARAETLLRETTGADRSMWGPEFEFYVFKKAEFDTRTSAAYYRVEHEEEFSRNAYHAANPFDLYDDFRDEACRLLAELGVPVKYHHHECGERGQQEIETSFMDLLTAADAIVTAKYALFNLARRHGLAVTFMPKPMYQQAGSGMHLHLFLTRRGKNAFHKAGEYGNLNELGRFFIGGLLAHAPALAAFTNPSTNSYKRLVPGFEAPVAITYGMGNRASAVRIPGYVKDPKETRFEYRPPDATMNPYLCLTAMLLAGIDGVVRKTDPRKEGFGPFDKNVAEGDASPAKLLPRSLDAALDALAADHDFLLRGGLFTEGLLDQWTKVKRRETQAIATMPHPYEYEMYFSL